MLRALTRSSFVVAAGAGLLVVAATTGAQAATVAVAPVRTINAGSTLPAMTLASNGTIYSTTGSSQIDQWSATSNGAPTVTKSYTGISPAETLSLSASAGLAYINSGTVSVLDPGQASGAAVPTRTITGASTEIDSPTQVAWASDGSLWVLDTEVAGNDQLQLLRFAPGATGDVAPVQVITGPATGLDSAQGIGTSFITALPHDGVAVAPTGFDPTISVFTGSQTGNVKPSRHIVVPTPGPHWLTEGVAADPQGRLYIGTGDYNGDAFGDLYVFGPTANGNAAPLLTLGGSRQRFALPLAPTVAPNGSLALDDATFVETGGSSETFTTVKVFNPLFAKPGAPTALKAKASGTKAVVSWHASTSPSGTPVTYRVTVKKGSRTVLSKATSATSLSVTRKSLPTGALAVTVSASTVGGSSAAARTTLHN